MHEKVLVARYSLDYVEIFSLKGEYERSITCDDCSLFFGEAVRTYEGELLKTIDNGNDWNNDVDISDEVIVFTTGQKTVVYNNTAPDFEEMVEIPQGGRKVATSGDKVVIGDYRTNDDVGSVWLYETDGKYIRTLEHDSDKFGRSVDITDDTIIVGA